MTDLFRRLVLVREAEKAEDEPIDITPKGFGVRTLVQEYGGGAFSVSGDTVIFANYDDQRLYKQSINSLGDLLCCLVLVSSRTVVFRFLY